MDCGSDSSILSYKDFKRFRLFERKLSLCGQFNLRGSTGTVQNCFIGPIQVKLFLQAEDGRFYHENVKISVARESLELPSILGIDFLKMTKCIISFNEETKILCTMKDYGSKSCTINIQKIEAVTSHFSNVDIIDPNSQSVTFHLENIENYMGQALFESSILDLPLVDFSALEKVFCYKNQVIRVKEENLELSIPILSPVEETYEKGQITAVLTSCYFIGNDTKSQLFEVTENEVMEKRDPELLYDLPGIPAVKNVNSSMTELPSCPEGHKATASDWEDEPDPTECSNLASNDVCPSLSQAVARSFSQEILRFEENSQEIFSFLAERKLIDEYSAEQNI